MVAALPFQRFVLLRFLQQLATSSGKRYKTRVVRVLQHLSISVIEVQLPRCYNAYE